MASIHQELNALDHLVTEYESRPVKRTHHKSFTSYDELVAYKQETVAQQIKTETELQGSITQLNETNQLVEALMIDQAVDQQGLENKLSTLEEQYSHRPTLPEYVTFTDELAVVELDLKAVISPLQHWASQTDDNLSPSWGKTEHQKIIDRHNVLSEHQDKLKAYIKRGEDRIETL